MDRTTVHTDSVAGTGKPYSQGVRYGDLLFVSGQVGLDSAGSLIEGLEAQTRRVLDNLTAILEAGGSSRELVLKTTCFLTDVADTQRFNEIYREYFPSNQPARSTVVVADLSPGFLVEVEAVAGVGRG